MDYLGGGGKGYVDPILNYWGGGAAPCPPSSYAGEVQVGAWGDVVTELEKQL